MSDPPFGERLSPDEETNVWQTPAPQASPAPQFAPAPQAAPAPQFAPAPQATPATPAFLSALPPPAFPLDMAPPAVAPQFGAMPALATAAEAPPGFGKLPPKNSALGPLPIGSITGEATYPDGYWPYLAPGVDPNAHGTVFLDVHRAAVPVYVVGAESGHPQLYVGMKKARRALFGGKVVVPLLDGDKSRIKWNERLIGYPVATLRQRELFRLSRAPGFDRFLIFFLPLTSFYLGGIGGFYVGRAFARWMATMIKRGDSKAKRRAVALVLTPVVVIPIGVATAVLLYVVLELLGYRYDLP